jgi:hypothetical protein
LRPRTAPQRDVNIAQAIDETASRHQSYKASVAPEVAPQPVP